MIDIRKLLEQGQAVQDKAHMDAEVAKRGNLRGGSAGVVGTDGKIYGECHRKSLARLLGADGEHEANRAIMFDAGNANEDSWAAKLIAAGAEILREDEIPIVWKIPGTDRIVTGRPDIILGRYGEDGPVSGNLGIPFTPEHGLELKGIYSASSAVRVEIEGMPDPKHLAQAGFYAMALNIPYTLCYTNPSVIETPYWAQKKFGAPKKLQPFYRLFELRWTDDGKLIYRDEQKEDWVTTTYTKEGIAQYYQLIVEMEQTKQLGPRPEGGWADGTEMPFLKCNYCPLKAACDAHEDNYDSWVSTVKGRQGG